MLDRLAQFRRALLPSVTPGIAAASTSARFIPGAGAILTALIVGQACSAVHPPIGASTEHASPPSQRAELQPVEIESATRSESEDRAEVSDQEAVNEVARSASHDLPAQTQPEPVPLVPPPRDDIEAVLRERQLIVDRLVQATRRLYDAAPPDQHGQLLTEMLGDSVPEIRSLGTTLVEAELADAERLPPEVGFALAQLLGSDDARVRATAARLLNRLAQPGLEGQIAEALSVEDDPATAAELLAASARQPDVRLVEPMLRWLRAEPPVREAAAQAGLALARADVLSPDARAHAAAALRDVQPESLSAPAIRLLARVGTHEDRASLSPLMGSPEPARRIAACEALGADPAFVNDVVRAAQADPGLIDVAIRSLAAHRPNLEGLALVQKLPFPTVEARTVGTAQFTAGMDLPTLIMAADETSRNPPFVEALLGNLEDAPPAVDHGNAVLRARALLRLAEARLAQSRPDRALALVDRIEPFAAELPESDQARLGRVRTISLLWLDRLEDPTLAESSVDHWLDALEIIGAQPLGPEVADLLLVRFGDKLTDPQRARFLDIEGRLLTGPRPAPNGTSGSAGGGGGVRPPTGIPRVMPR